MLEGAFRRNLFNYELQGNVMKNLEKALETLEKVKEEILQKNEISISQIWKEVNSAVELIKEEMKGRKK